MMKKIKNNKGYSLVELIVAFSILSVVAMTTLMLMSAGTNMFTTTSAENSLQAQATIISTQLNSYASMSSGGICRETTSTDDIIYICDTHRGVVNVIRYNKNDKKIYFGSQPYAGELVAEEPLSGNVEEFECNIATNKGQVESISFSILINDNGKTFPLELITSVRSYTKYYTATDGVHDTVKDSMKFDVFKNV